MKLTHIHLLFILLAALVLCSFLGGVGCTREGMEDGSDENEDNEATGSVNTYYGANGNKVVAVKGPNGNNILVDADYNENPNYSQTTYSNNDGSVTATTGPQGNTLVTSSNENPNYNQTTYSNNNGSVTATTGPQGNTWVTSSNNNGALVTNSGTNNIPSGDEDLYILKSQVVPPVCPACPGITPASLNGDTDVNIGDTSNTTTTITGPQGNSITKNTTSTGTSITGTSITGTTTGTSGNNSCNSCNKPSPPPCPPCARCPEPSFECKKVQSYKQGSSNAYLPRPVLSDFSTFGM